MAGSPTSVVLARPMTPGRAVTPQTPFIIGSVAKSFTALAIMQLVEAKRIDLDAPVQRYLPWFRVADERGSAEITVRHLLNHTSGISTKTGRTYQGDGDTSDTALEQAVRKLKSAELSAPVGSKHQYSTINYSVLGLIVQTVTGQSYESYVQAKILEPLQMRHSFTSETAAQPAGLASGYNYAFGRPRASHQAYNRGLVPAGYLIASAEDMTHYVVSQLNGGQYEGASVLSSGGIGELHRPAVPTPKEGNVVRHGLVCRPTQRHPCGPPPGRDVQLPLERRADPTKPKWSGRPHECGELPRPLHRWAHGNDRRRCRQPARRARATVAAVEHRDLHRLRGAVCAARAASPRHCQVGQRAASRACPTRPDRPAVADRLLACAEPDLGAVRLRARSEAAGPAAFDHGQLGSPTSSTC